LAENRATSIKWRISITIEAPHMPNQVEAVIIIQQKSTPQVDINIVLIVSKFSAFFAYKHF
jgi:hypothetical protein